MFERRLKIFLAALVAITLVLMLRTLQIQVVKASDLKKAAATRSERYIYLDTVRGRLLDVKGREIAREVPCINAAVDYRALGVEPDPTWLDTAADSELRRRLGEDYTKLSKTARAAMRKNELPAMHKDIAAMWAALAACPGMNDAKIDEIRQGIVTKVEARQHAIWRVRYEAAVSKAGTPTTRPWYSRWIFNDARPPDPDHFFVKIGDQLQPQTIVPNLDAASVTRLGKSLDQYPGLKLMPSTHREYPYRDIGCHVIGYVNAVNDDDLTADLNKSDLKRKYEPSDEIGRSGLEKLAEPVLRGSRGMTVYDSQGKTVIAATDAVPGSDVHTTIDFELQAQIQKAFHDLVIHHATEPTEDYPVVFGAAVVLDVPTGEVRAMVSNPVYDLNEFTQEKIAEMSKNVLEHPLRNRATMDAVEPGSTVKPAVGLWGMKSGVLRIDEAIPCNGVLVWQGNRYGWGRCWVAKRLWDPKTNKYKELPINHPIPDAAPLNRPLTFADALERSCNPFHETVALRLTAPRLTEGLSNFGLGRATGVGIGEAIGSLPPMSADMSSTAMAGIGQGYDHATPLQMANLAATVGRGGVWQRPRVVCEDAASSAIVRPPLPGGWPDRFDLQIPPAAIAMAKQGMYLVVHGGAAATGSGIDFNPLDLCGKTGTAEVGHIQQPKLDATGQKMPLLNPDGTPQLKNGQPRYVMEDMPFSTPGAINPIAPWYIGGGPDHKDASHAWYIGFVPRDKPKIAFAVLIEYGGSGGGPAAVVAHRVLQACLDQHYLSKDDERHE